jgi:hypothetical protein
MTQAKRKSVVAPKTSTPRRRREIPSLGQQPVRSRQRATLAESPVRFRRLAKLRQNYHLNREPWPTIGALAAGGAGLALASATGLTELAVGGAMAYAAYRMLRDGVSPRVAFRQGVTIERDAIAGKRLRK